MNKAFFILALIFCIIPGQVFAQTVMQDFPKVKLQALDKSTARTVTLEANVGTTLEYGSLFIKILACRKSDPLSKPESAAFLQIWEVPIKAEKSEWVFSGWMFSSSPALSAMDHAVYDVWVLDCIDNKKPAPEAATPAPATVTTTETQPPAQEENTEEEHEEPIKEEEEEILD